MHNSTCVNRHHKPLGHIEAKCAGARPCPQSYKCNTTLNVGPARTNTDPQQTHTCALSEEWSKGGGNFHVQRDRSWWVVCLTINGLVRSNATLAHGQPRLQETVLVQQSCNYSTWYPHASRLGPHFGQASYFPATSDTGCDRAILGLICWRHQGYHFFKRRPLEPRFGGPD